MGRFYIDAHEANHNEMHEVLRNAQYIANTCHCTVIVKTSVGALEVKGYEEEKEQENQHDKGKP